MKKLKQLFIIPFLLLSLVATLHGVVSIAIGNGSLAWWSVIVSCGPMLGFMAYLAKSGVVSTSPNMPIQVTGAVVGGLMALVGFDPVPSLYTLLVGCAGTLLYVFWYSRFDRGKSMLLDVGRSLPEFEFLDSDGKMLSTRDFIGKPTVYMFYRGSWCPLCVAQVKGVSEQYRKLNELGVATVLLSPQGQEDSRALAEKFEVPLIFGFDKNLDIARRLGIIHQYGSPPGMKGDNGEDTVFPTVVITDASGKILWSDQTNNYRVRPETETILEVLSDLHVV